MNKKCLVMCITILVALGVGSAYAGDWTGGFHWTHNFHRTLKFHGTYGGTEVSIPPYEGYDTGEGKSNLGPWTYTVVVQTTDDPPGETPECPAADWDLIWGFDIPTAQVLNFRRWGLLFCEIVPEESYGCYNFATGPDKSYGYFFVTYEITGGTGKFENATGTLVDEGTFEVLREFPDPWFSAVIGEMKAKIELPHPVHFDEDGD